MKTFDKLRGASRSVSTPLYVLAVILILSGVLRLGDGIGRAIALEADRPAQTDSSVVQPVAADLAQALAALRERENRLTEREIALENRLKALAVAEDTVRMNLAELAAAEERLRSLIATVEESAEGDLVQLTAVYENMKPKEAALLFEQMSPDFAAGFLGRMRPDAAAAILSGLKPETAYTISVLLAGRNADAAAAIAGN